MASLIRTEPEKDGDLRDLLNTFKDTDQSNTDEGGATEEFLVLTDGSDTDEDRGSQNVLDYGSLERFLFGFFIWFWFGLGNISWESVVSWADKTR